MENNTRLESWNNYCDDFVNHLRNSKAVFALLGAGLSASSGISTYQGSGSTWQGHLVRDLATKSRFERDPVLVWEYYRHRQAEILSAVPNAGHFALAGLATIKPDLLTITQNVDANGYTQRSLTTSSSSPRTAGANPRLVARSPLHKHLLQLFPPSQLP
ncbi:hypothetical protein D6C80_01827 [Aureobasidium pullulans]|nr:hypothetical protein D6C80_01827 [Aureobasidium pullulans]